MKSAASKKNLDMRTIATFVAQGQLSDAFAALAKLVKKNPRDYDALLGLSHLLDLKGDVHGAIEYASRATAIASNRLEGYCQLGQLYKKLRKFDDATLCFQKAVSLAPGASQLWHSLGLVCMENGRMAEAIANLEKAVSLDASFAIGHYNLANALKKYGRLSESIIHYKKALALKRDFIEAKNNLGNAYISLGDLGEAEACFEEILKEDPGFLNAVSGLARICDYRRDFDKALSLLDPYARKRVGHVGLAATFADMARSTGRTAEAILWLETVVANASIPDQDKARAHFILGKLKDAADDYDAAFEEYHKANQIRRTHYDINATKRYFESIKQSFPRNTIEEFAATESCDPRPVFIVGMPRSGTSLVEQILAGSPDVYAAGETEDIDLLVSRAAQHSSTAQESLYEFTNIGKNEIEALSIQYSKILDQRCGSARRHLNKMPHNFVQLGWINLIAPAGRIIHCVRDPLDTCLSCYFQDFSGFHPYANDLTDLAQYYCLYADLMMHWTAVSRVPIKRVCYEQLVADPEGVSKEIFAFCDIEWRTEYLKTGKTRRIVTTLSYDQVRRPIYSTSVNRWKNYVKHIEALRNELGRLGVEGVSWEDWCGADV